MDKSRRNDFLAILRAFLTQADQEGPRKALADLFEEEGDPEMARMIRGQPFSAQPVESLVADETNFRERMLARVGDARVRREKKEQEINFRTTSGRLVAEVLASELGHLKGLPLFYTNHRHVAAIEQTSAKTGQGHLVFGVRLTVGERGMSLISFTCSWQGITTVGYANSPHPSRPVTPTEAVKMAEDLVEQFLDDGRDD